jgi:hypothetical protein
MFVLCSCGHYRSTLTSSSSLLALVVVLKVFFILLSVFWTGTRDLYFGFHNASTVRYVTTVLLCSVYLVIRTGNMFVGWAVFFIDMLVRFVLGYILCAIIIVPAYCTIIGIYCVIMLWVLRPSQSFLQVVGRSVKVLSPFHCGQVRICSKLAT